MHLEEVALSLAELGHQTRLKIFRYLVKVGECGTPVGDIQRELAIPASTLSHHISKLIRVNLIDQQRDGRVLYCRARYDNLQNILDFLTDECCAGNSCTVKK